MKSNSTNRLLPLVLAASAAIAGPASAANLFWNPATLSNTWDVTMPNWATTAGGTPNQVWAAGDSANFTASSAYTVNVSGDRTATLTHVAAGTVTLTGSNVASDSVTIDADATLVAPGTRIAKTGITPIAINGTLDVSEAPSAGGRYLQISGTGTLIGTIRYNGTSEFAGNVEDSGSLPTAIVINDGTSSYLTLSGDNSGMTGDILIGLPNSTLKLASANALGPNVYLRLEGVNGGSVNLASTDLTRVWATGSNASGAGGIRLNGSKAFFYATGADRNFTLVTEPGGTTPADVVWGLNGLEGDVGLGNAAATHTITWTNNIDLNKATRTVNVPNGAAAVDAVLSGEITGEPKSVLTKTGAGRLLLNNSNSHEGGTVIAGSQTGPNPLRVSTGDALGSGPLTIGGGGNVDQASLEIIGGITIANPVTQFTSRGNDAPSIVSLSGDNTLTANLSAGGGGNRTTIQVDADTLTLSGTYNGRMLNLTGAGDGKMTNAVTLSVGLNKRDAGMWTLSGGFTYVGPTNVEGGTLAVTTPSFDDTSAVDISGDAVLQLDFTGTDLVGSLVLDGDDQSDGIYDSSNSGGLITGAGKLQVGGAASGGYADYLTAAGIPGEPATGDYDHDGIPNIVEYALGLDPKASSVPAGTFDGTTLSFTKGAAAIAGEDVNYIIQTSTDLGISDPWTAVMTQNAGDSATAISYSLPKTGPRLFARLKVVQVP